MRGGLQAYCVGWMPLAPSPTGLEGDCGLDLLLAAGGVGGVEGPVVAALAG